MFKQDKSRVEFNSVQLVIGVEYSAVDWSELVGE
jgi:hypothetical protein